MHKLAFDIIILLCKINKESLTEYPKCGILLLGRYAHKLNTDRMTDSGETGFTARRRRGMRKLSGKRTGVGRYSVEQAQPAPKVQPGNPGNLSGVLAEAQDALRVVPSFFYYNKRSCCYESAETNPAF